MLAATPYPVGTVFETSDRRYRVESLKTDGEQYPIVLKRLTVTDQDLRDLLPSADVSELHHESCEHMRTDVIVQNFLAMPLEVEWRWFENRKIEVLS